MGSDPFLFHWREYCTQFLLPCPCPQNKKRLTNGFGSSRVLLTWSEGWGAWHTVRGWGNWIYLVWRREGNRFFSELLSEKTRGNRYKLQPGKFRWDICKKFFFWGWPRTRAGSQRACSISILGDFPNLTGYGSEQPALALKAARHRAGS